MYADMEALFVKPEDEAKILQRHEPCAVGSYLVPHKDMVYHQTIVKFQGRSCVEDFCKYI